MKLNGTVWKFARDDINTGLIRNSCQPPHVDCSQLVEPSSQRSTSHCQPSVAAK